LRGESGGGGGAAIGPGVGTSPAGSSARRFNSAGDPNTGGEISEGSQRSRRRLTRSCGRPQPRRRSPFALRPGRTREQWLGSRVTIRSRVDLLRNIRFGAQDARSLARTGSSRPPGDRFALVRGFGCRGRGIHPTTDTGSSFYCPLVSPPQSERTPTTHLRLPPGRMASYPFGTARKPVRPGHSTHGRAWRNVDKAVAWSTCPTIRLAISSDLESGATLTSMKILAPCRTAGVAAQFPLSRAMRTWSSRRTLGSSPLGEGSSPTETSISDSPSLAA